MTNEDQPADEPAGVTAAERLEQGVTELRVPEPSADMERALIRLGMALPIVGLVLIGVAWYGASGTGYVADQIPYLISGGLVGLGLVLIGGGLFLRYSFTHLIRYGVARLVYEQQAQADRLVGAMSSLEQTILSVNGTAPDPVAPVPDRATGAAAEHVPTTTGN